MKKEKEKEVELTKEEKAKDKKEPNLWTCTSNIRDCLRRIESKVTFLEEVFAVLSYDNDHYFLDNDGEKNSLVLGGLRYILEDIASDLRDNREELPCPDSSSPDSLRLIKEHMVEKG